MSATFIVDGRPVTVDTTNLSLLEVLRDQLGVRGPKDGCSPQGQCGCCTVLVDGQPRVACVTPAARVAGRTITTIDSLDGAERWGRAFCAAGASQCGFCTPGIITRLSALTPAQLQDRRAVDQALLAHLCRCTGWQTIVEACGRLDQPGPTRDLEAAARRAALEGGAPQRVDPEVALGRGGFADDTCPPDALVAVLDAEGNWHVADGLHAARAAAGRIQGRRTTAPLRWPLEVPPGPWARTLRTTWVEPAYLEPDVAWCEPGGEPASPLANGGAFGGKLASMVAGAARALADEHGRCVKAVLTREDVVRLGPKRPPVAGGVDAHGSGLLRVVATPGVAEAVAAVAPGLEVEELEVAGPPTSVQLRGAGWMEAAVLVAAATGADEIVAPGGGWARAEVTADGVLVEVGAGEVLDEVVLRSYCIGAAHQGLGWVRSEGLSVDAEGQVHDLTIRSFGVLRSNDTPPIEVRLGQRADQPPVNGSDAVMAAVALAAWRQAGLPQDWPTSRR